MGHYYIKFAYEIKKSHLNIFFVGGLSNSLKIKPFFYHFKLYIIKNKPILDIITSN